MEAVVAIIIIVLAFISSRNKANIKAKKRQTQASALRAAFNDTEEESDRPTRRARPAPAQPTVRPSVSTQQAAAAQPTLRPSVPAQPVPGPVIPAQPVASRPVDSPLRINALPMGASLADEEGCIGGSMPVHAHEGESRAEHAEHLQRSRPQPTVGSPRGINRAELRRAVVMAEILDRPKALRSAGLRK